MQAVISKKEKFLGKIYVTLKEYYSNKKDQAFIATFTMSAVSEVILGTLLRLFACIFA